MLESSLFRMITSSFDIPYYTFDISFLLLLKVTYTFDQKLISGKISRSSRESVYIYTYTYNLSYLKKKKIKL